MDFEGVGGGYEGGEGVVGGWNGMGEGEGRGVRRFGAWGLGFGCFMGFLGFPCWVGKLDGLLGEGVYDNMNG